MILWAGLIDWVMGIGLSDGARRGWIRGGMAQGGIKV